MRGTRASDRPSAGTRETPSWDSRSSGQDAAVVPVVEAIIIALIVGGAMIFAASFQTAPPPTAAPGAEELEERSWDAFSTLDGMYYEDPSAANSSLSKAVRDALAGEPENLTAALKTYLPPGAEFNVYLNNGFDRMPVHESRDPSGQSVGISYPFEPRWRTTFTEPALRYYPETSAGSLSMGVTNIPLFNSNLIPGEGHLVKAEAVGTQDWVHGSLIPTGSTIYHEDGYSTLLQGNDDVDYTSVSISMGCSPTNRTCYVMDLTSTPLETFGPVLTLDGDTDGIPILLRNAGPRTLPAGAKVTVEFPVGVPVKSTWDDDPSHTWNIGRFGQSPNPQTVVAELRTDLAAGDTAQFQINASTTDARYVYKHLSAQLSSLHSSSQSQFLLKVQDKPPETQTGGDTRVLLLSGPQPAGSMDGGTDPTGRWAMVLSNPVRKTTLKGFNLSLPDEDAVFKAAKIPDAPGDDVYGTYETFYHTEGQDDWTIEVDENNINWTLDNDGHEIDAWGFAEMQFEVTTDGRFTKASPAFEPTRPEARYSGYTPAPMVHQTEPGIWWEEFPPQTTGVGQEDTGALPGYPIDNDTLTGRLQYRNQVLSDETRYRVENLDADTPFGSPGSQITIQDALRAASVDPSSRTVSIGDSVTITVDALDLATVLSSELPVNDLELKSHVYAPWGIIDRIPAQTKTHTAQAGLSHSPNDIEVQDLDGDGFHDIIAAYSDGNVYGLDSETGSPVSGRTWSVPFGGTPTLLSKGRDSLSNPFYGVGTSGSTERLHAIDHSGSVTEKWNESKHDSESPKSLAINASFDIDDDGHDDLLHRQPSSAPSPYPGVQSSKLLLFDGDSGTLFPGHWSLAEEEGVIIPGRSDQIGMGILGPDPKNGVYSNTAGGVGTNVVTQTNQTWEPCGGINLDDPSDCDDSAPVSLSTSLSVTGSGLMGFYEDGDQAWNYSGGDFLRILNTDRIPTGGDWTGLLAGGGEGFLYGLSAEVPVNPGDGWVWVGAQQHQDIDMANGLEGYLVGSDGWIGATRSGVADWAWALPAGTPRGVGTIDAPYDDPRTEVVYAVGDSGALWRSTDRLATLEDISGVGAVINVLQLSLDDPDIDLDPSALETLDLTKVDFKDVLVKSEDEAYFVGGGKSGTTADGNAYVVHTMDGGASLLVTEIACEDTDGNALAGCTLNAITSNGTALWAAGTHGMVLAQNNTGDMQNVSLHDDQPDPKVAGDGFVHLNLSNLASTELRDVQVLWTNKTDLSHYQNLRVDTGSGNDTLWSLSDDGTGLYVDGTFDATKGAGRGAALDLRGFDDNKDLLGDPDDNIWNGDATLKIGPFVNETTGTTPIDASDFPAVNMTFVLTYGDGSQDLMTIGVQGSQTNPDIADDNESPGGLWAAANRTGYTTTGCFGPPKAGCGTHHGINFTTNKTSGNVMGVVAGERQTGPNPALDQWPLYRLDEGTTTWDPQRNLYNEITLYDAAISSHDVDRWAAVGNGSRVFMSFNAAQNWTELPPVDVKDRQVSDLKAVDLTHPKVGYTVGGSGTMASVVTLGGYSEFGQVITNDLYDGSTPIETVRADHSDLEVYVDGGFNSEIEIQVQDGDGSWETLINSETGAHPAVFDTPTTELKVRWNLSVPNPWNRFSPQAVGSLTLVPEDEDGNVITPPTPSDLTIDLSGTDQWASGTKTLDLDTDRSMMRLFPAQVPWLTKLGNYTQADRGARPADVGISPDGWTAFVGTEGVYKIGGAYQSVPEGSDNSLYAYNITDGTTLPGFDPPTFDEPVQFVLPFENGVYVITDDTGVETKLYHVELDGTKSLRDTLDGGEVVVDAELARVNAGAKDDLVLALYNPVEDDGTLEVRMGTGLTGDSWKKSPAVKGFFQFDYDVDRDSMFGAYVIQSEFNWTMTTEEGQSITQSARIHNAFTVVPPNREVALSPTYTLELVAWMEDWG